MFYVFGMFLSSITVLSAGIVFISGKFWIIASFLFFFKQTSAASAYRLSYHCVLPAGSRSKQDMGGKRDAAWQAVELGRELSLPLFWVIHSKTAPSQLLHKKRHRWLRSGDAPCYDG